VGSSYYNFLVLTQWPDSHHRKVSTSPSSIPDRFLDPSWAPVISPCPPRLPGTTYIPSRNAVNGLTQGAYFGGRRTSGELHPIVQISRMSATGHVFYGRTFTSATGRWRRAFRSLHELYRARRISNWARVSLSGHRERHSIGAGSVASRCDGGGKFQPESFGLRTGSELYGDSDRGESHR